MNSHNSQARMPLAANGTVVVIGGGPAGSFFAIHLLRRARVLQRPVRVVIFERRRQASCPDGCASVEGWRGCSYCAGGLSPRLIDALRELDLSLPAEVVQSRIHSITVQGYWKNIELSVPEGREMLSVFRGVRPVSRSDRQHSLDAVLLERAVSAGAELVSGEVCDVDRSASGRPAVSYRTNGRVEKLEAEMVVFAAGVNERAVIREGPAPAVRMLRRLVPDYAPPQLRPALIFELAMPPEIASHLEGHLHFVEYGSPAVRLEMCSLLPKREYVTVVLVGPSVDASRGPVENGKIIDAFLELPHVRKLLRPSMGWRMACACNPRLVIGAAQHPFGDRVAAVGDLAASRLYKDGILSACETSEALAETVLGRGVDRRSLQAGYAPTIQRFRRDNRFAALVFLLHRLVFGSSVWSRILYQAVVRERRRRIAAERRLESILWKIASGDDQYEATFRAMIHPATLWLILADGACITLRSHLTERFFRLNWEGFGRYRTGVAREQLETKRATFRQELTQSGAVVPRRPDFERMFTIRIRARAERLLEELGRFGEPDRGYLRPRGLRIRRTHGQPNQPGCVIRYEIFRRWFSFRLQLERVAGNHLLVYRVKDGFARGGVLLFEIEPATSDACDLSIYVAFNFARGATGWSRPLWWLFRWLFPGFVHDVLWNHSLCELKSLVEAEVTDQPADEQRAVA